MPSGGTLYSYLLFQFSGSSTGCWLSQSESARCFALQLLRSDYFLGFSVVFDSTDLYKVRNIKHITQVTFLALGGRCYFNLNWSFVYSLWEAGRPVAAKGTKLKVAWSNHIEIFQN